MTNAEALKKYGSLEFIVQEILSHLCHEYGERCNSENGKLRRPNAVTVVKDFMKKETLIYEDLADKALERAWRGVEVIEVSPENITVCNDDADTAFRPYGFRTMP